LILPSLALASVPDSRPPPLTLSEAESSTVSKGKVVIRSEVTDTGGMVTGVVDIDAPPEAVWAALFDLGARVSEIGALDAVSTYQEGEPLGVRWELKVLGTRITFHNLYHSDPEAGWCRYALDPSRENDLVSVEGAYQIYPAGDSTRLVYRSMTDSGRTIPAFVKNWLGSRSMLAQIEGIRARAESR
jgi:carbon monoxide dehydrogenase subunit G